MKCMPALIKLFTDDSLPSAIRSITAVSSQQSHSMEENVDPALSPVAFVEPLMEKLTKKTKQLVTAVYCLSHRLESAMDQQKGELDLWLWCVCYYSLINFFFL